MTTRHLAGRACALARLAAAADTGWLTRDRDGAPVLGRAALLLRRDEIVAALSSPDLTAEDAERLATEAEEVRGQIEAHNASVQRAEAARAALLGADLPAEQRGGLQPQQPPGSAPAAPDTRSLGTRVVESDALRLYRERGFSGQIAIDVPGNVRALLDNAPTSAGAFQNPARVPEVITAQPDRPLRLADLIDRRPTGDNTVEYVQETTAANGGETAREVAEGALKPEATFTFQVVTDSVRTIAHWVNLTRQSAEDNAQVVGYVEGRLAFGLEYRLDRQILQGDGTAPNLRGILNHSGLGTYVAPAGEAAVLSVRKAITVAQMSEYGPDTLVCNPVDWERIELSTSSDGMFRVNPNVSNVLAPRIWGLNVVPTTGIPGTAVGVTGGTALLGSFRMGATLWERDGVRVLMTDSHASNFTSNILTLLAEMRAALSVWRPRAFVKITLDPAGA